MPDYVVTYRVTEKHQVTAADPIEAIVLSGRRIETGPDLIKVEDINVEDGEIDWGGS